MSGAGERTLPVAEPDVVRRESWRLIRDDRLAMTVVVLLNALAALAALGGPWLLGRIVNIVESGDVRISTIDGLALAVVGFALAQLLFTGLARYAAHRFGERALARLREGVVDAVLALPTRVVERTSTGDLMTRSSSDVTTVGTTLRDAVPEVVISGLQMAFIVVAVFLLHPLLGLCVMLGLPAIWLVMRWYLKRARTAYLAEGAASAAVMETVVTTAEGAKTVEAFGLQRNRIAEADLAVDRVYAARARTLGLRTVLFPVTDIAHSVPTVATLIVGGIGYAHGTFSLGAVISASLYVWQLADPLDRVLMWMEQLQSSGAAFARIKGIDLVKAPEEAPRTAVPRDDRLELSGVRYSYTGGRDVLHDVSLTVRPGERLAIVGPSGAGKSTLARLMAGLDVPSAGSVRCGGVPMPELAADRRVLLVTQEHHVFLGTLRENLAMAAPSTDDAAMLTALAAVDADWVDTLPGGLDTPLGGSGHRLDPAQSQQLALARVLLANPHTLILDEATAMLDPATARHAERATGAVLAGRTVIAIAHRLHTAHDADRVAVVEDGRIAELGTHDELVAANGVYAALWRSWHGAE